jgi:hypothetical protein
LCQYLIIKPKISNYLSNSNKRRKYDIFDQHEGRLHFQEILSNDKVKEKSKYMHLADVIFAKAKERPMSILHKPGP